MSALLNTRPACRSTRSDKSPSPRGRGVGERVEKMQSRERRLPIQRARILRQNQTETERMIWRFLRAGRFKEYKFRRQYPIGRYIVDFACLELRLVIEIDGSQHNENWKDAERTAFLNKFEYEVLRFWNNDVIRNIDGVLEMISLALTERERILRA